MNIPCHIDVPDEYRKQARYGLEMLLLPFRAELTWVSLPDLPESGVYYGTRPDRAPDGALRIGLLETTLDFFQRRIPVPDSSGSVTMGGHDIPVLFPCNGNAAFDLVAYAFYFLSGWQELHTKRRDEHGRFCFEDSVQDRFQLAHVPVVDLCRALFQKELGVRGHVIERKEWNARTWALCPTHDIDYLKKWRLGILYREIVERAVFNRKREPISKRGKRVGRSLAGLAAPNDPYASAITKMISEVGEVGGTATYFFKAAARGPRDVPYKTQGTFIQRQFFDLRTRGFEIGLHPSYHAYSHARFLREEKAILERSTGVNISSCRTHFLRFDPAESPRVLLDAGFDLDSTLGFAGQEGFRRGTCLPFPFFDITRNEGLAIWEMPLILMESALFNRRHLDLEEAKRETKRLLDICQQYGGAFVGLWHNLLWDEADFPGWGDHFSYTLSYAHASKATISSLRAAFESWK